MFSGVLQPSTVSLFSSTGSEPLQLWSTTTDGTAQSSVHLLHDATAKSLSSLIAPPPLADLGGVDRSSQEYYQDPGYALDQTVLQIQSPRLPTTYIQCPDRGHSLGLKHPWMHLHVRNMGKEWSLEVGLVDQSGRTGVLRMSTFQVLSVPYYHYFLAADKRAVISRCETSDTSFVDSSDLSKQPRLKLNRTDGGNHPLLHLPLTFPSRSSRPLTGWTTVHLHLPSFIPYFSHANLLTSDGKEEHQGNNTSPSWDTCGTLPSGSYSHVAYIRIYATCRLRRMWFDENGPSHSVPWEFELYSAD